MLDFSNLTAPTTVALMPGYANDPSRTFKHYHEIRWAANSPTPLLFGASEDSRIDLFALSFAGQ